MSGKTQQSDPSVSTDLRAVRDKDPFRALGLTVNHLMTQTAFADRKFGEWSKILVGQINRGHYLLIVRGKTVVGFFGWAFVDAQKADLWLAGKRGLSYEESINGDSLLINAWEGDEKETVDFVKQKMREVAKGKKYIYFKRFYDNGKARASKVSANRFISRHLDRL